MSADSDTPNAASGAPTPPPGRVYEVLTAGEQIGEFTVEACLAYDILGSLYHVTGMDGIAKTLFVLPKILTEDEAFQRRFKEFKAKLVQLNHPRILGMGESRQVDGRICFVAEPSSGKSLPDYLGAAGIYPTFQNPQGIVRAQPSEASRDFTPDKVRKVAREVLEALDFANSQGVLHLNLTPGNMLLLENGDIKVLGFGLYGSIGTHSIELLVSAGIPPVSLGPRNVRLTTADIISPEVHLKQEPDQRADLYAFGMSMYWLLTGLKCGANYRPPSGIVPGLEPGWDIFLARCLTREKSKRYSNAKAALKDLENLEKLHEPGYADDIAGAAASGSTAAPAKKGPNKNLLIAAAGVACLLVAGAGAYFLLSSDGETAEDHVQQNSPVTRQAGSTPADITLRITPASARVAVIPGLSDFGVTDGALRLTAKPGKYTLTITAADLLPQKVVVTVDAGKPVTRAITLFKEVGTVDVSTAPDARVSLLPESGPAIDVGDSDANGKISAKVGAGTYTLVVEREGAKATLPGVVVTNGEHLAKTVEIAGAPASLSLLSEPEGANVTIDGADVGVTPITLEKLKSGREMTVVFSKTSYRSVTRKVVLNPSEKRELTSGPMAAARGVIAYDLKLSGRTPTAGELAYVTVERSDDGLRSHSWSEALAMPKEVPVGYYMLKVNHPDYEPYQSAFTVRDEETAKVEINLRALPARFELLGLPSGLKYKLRLNNREYTSPPAEVPAGVHTKVEIEARDYELWTGEFTAPPKDVQVLRVAMKRIGPPVFGAPYVVPYMETRLAWIPSGETRLGSPATETGHTAVEEPATFARFEKGFWMSATEVTQLEYERVLGANPSRFRAPDKPVDSVSHADAIRYCKALTRREYEAGRLPADWEYRLPNEVEWEYACRAGTTAAFAFGDKVSPVNGNFSGTYPPNGGALAKGTVAVGSYPANAYGLHDMHGNVREWTQDPYKAHLPGGRKVDFNLASDQLEGDDTFAARGGSWKTTAVQSRSAARPTSGIRGGTIADDLGFRIVLAPVNAP